MADCERGLGRPDRALDLARSPEAEDLDTAGKVELAIVTSGARVDLEQFEAAVSALEIPQLDRNRAFSFSPRLFRAYADALEAVGRAEEAGQWRAQALVAEKALGVGDYAEPDILDLDEEDDGDHSQRRSTAAAYDDDESPAPADGQATGAGAETAGEGETFALESADVPSVEHTDGDREDSEAVAMSLGDEAEQADAEADGPEQSGSAAEASGEEADEDAENSDEDSDEAEETGNGLGFGTDEHDEHDEAGR
jgi:hypothetical protein